MKKLCACALTLMLLALPALAEITIDPETATLDELREARDLLDAEIRAREEADAETYPAGSYAVGRDIPVGTYVVYPDGSSSVSSMAVHAEVNGEDMLRDFETVRVQLVIAVQEGETLELDSAYAVPLAASQPVDLTGGAISYGGYVVGIHLPAGEYTLSPAPDALLPNYNVRSGPMSADSTILAFAMIREPVQITLADGQYLQLSSCTISPVQP